MAGFRAHLAGAGVFGLVYLGVLVAVYAVDAAYDRFSLLELAAYPAVLFMICLLFALWPDVDTASLSRKIFYSLFLIVDVTLVATRHYQEAAYLGLFALVPLVSRHRGWTHSWWAMVLVPAPLFVLPLLMLPDRPFSGLPFYGAAVTGYFSHLVLDRLAPARRRAHR